MITTEVSTSKAPCPFACSLVAAVLFSSSAMADDQQPPAETTLADLAAKVGQGFENMERGFKRVYLGFEQIAGQFSNLEQKLTGKIDASEFKLSQKMDEILERVTNEANAADTTADKVHLDHEERITAIEKELTTSDT